MDKGIDEHALERSIIEMMKKKNFHYKKSDSYLWLTKNFGKKITHIDARAICSFFSEFIGRENYGREWYRRKQTCFFWIDEHMNDIKNFLNQHTVVVEMEHGLVQLHTSDMPQPSEKILISKL